MKQLELFNSNLTRAFGGSLLSGKRHDRRPLSTKSAVHLVLRAGGSPNLLSHKRLIEYKWNAFAKRHGIKSYRFALCGNHVHALLRIHDRPAYVRFVRAITGALAKTLRVKWAYRPFTRLVKWGRDFARAAAYVWQNYLEAEGLIAYKPRVRTQCNWRSERGHGRIKPSGLPMTYEPSRGTRDR